MIWSAILLNITCNAYIPFDCGSNLIMTISFYDDCHIVNEWPTTICSIFLPFQDSNSQKLYYIPSNATFHQLPTIHALF